MSDKELQVLFLYNAQLFFNTRLLLPHGFQIQMHILGSIELAEQIYSTVQA